MEKTPDKRACRYVETPIGPLTLVACGEALVEARFGGFPIAHESPVLDMAERELKEYFARQRRDFDVPLAPQGTPFQLSVWEEVRSIPYGETRAYLDVARALGNEKACRAVGRANNRNPLPLFVPCHRVIGRDGALVGYAGGLAAKKWLLRLEREQ